MTNDSLAPLRKALLASATRKLHLGVGGVAVGLALGASVAELGGQVLPAITLGLGLLAYGAMVALDVTNPAFIRQANSRVRVAEQKALQALDPNTLRDPEMREAYKSILVAFTNCRHVYESAGEGLRSNLEDGLRRSEELVTVAGRAARRSDAIHRHLTADSPSGLSTELARLQILAEQTQDETARRGFLQAADAKAKELETYRQLQGLRDRIHAQLELIGTSLDGLSAKLVKLDATDVSEAISINESIAEHVQTMTSDVELLESTFEETFQEYRV